jgi:hypothetical protein
VKAEGLMTHDIVDSHARDLKKIDAILADIRNSLATILLGTAGRPPTTAHTQPALVAKSSEQKDGSFIVSATFFRLWTRESSSVVIEGGKSWNS